MSGPRGNLPVVAVEWFTAERAPAWRRIVAYLLDCIVIDIYLAVLSAVFWTARALDAEPWAPSSPLLGQFVLILILTVPAMLYLAGTEASPWQATLGKRLLRLRVEGRACGRPTLAQTLLRAFLKLFVPWELAHVVVHRVGSRVTATMEGGGLDFADAVNRVELQPGEAVLLWIVAALMACYVLTLFTPSGRTIYDRVAGTRVVSTWVA
ncbi:MAG: RDD family protein [Planctomycetota bacterium]|jgi:uncharacterized RDD family membrane protein YckC